MRPVVILGIVFFSLLSFSCKKYQDGPYMSLRSKEGRLINTWNCVAVNTYTNEGLTPVGDDRLNRVLELKEDGAFNLYFLRLGAIDFVLDSISGDWFLGQNKEALDFDCSFRYTEDSPYDSLFYYDINMLKTGRLKLVDENNDEFDFIPAN